MTEFDKQFAVFTAKARYELLAEHVGDGITLATAEGLLCYVSPGIQRMFGYTPDELIGTDGLWLLHPEDLPAVVAAAQACPPDEMVVLTYRVICKDGSHRWVEARSRFVTLPGDAATRWSLIESRDISEFKRLEATLRESERQVASVLGNLPGMVYRCLNDPQWTMVFVSEGCHELTGYACDDFIGNRVVSFDQLYHPEDQARIWDEVQQALSERRIFEVTYRITDRAGREKWVWEKGRGVFGADGGLLFLEGLLIDISSQRRLADQLAQREAQLSDAQQVARLGSWEWDMRTGGLIWSDEHYRLLGLTPGTVEPSMELLLAHVHPEDQADMRDKLTQAQPLPDTPRFENEFRLQLAGGEVRMIHARGEVIKDADGQLLKLVGTIQDVTDWRTTERALKASEERYRLLADNANDMIALLSPDADFTYVSPSSERITGYAPAALVGHSSLAQVDPEYIQLVREALAHASATDEPARVAFRYRQAAGQPMWLESIGRAVRAEDGETLVGFLVSTRDISERKRAEADMMAAHDELRQLGLAKDEFLATISHELRTPLATILNAVAILARQKAGALSDDQARFVGMIRDNVIALHRLVDDMLDFQSLEAGQAPSQLEPIDLREPVKAVLDEQADTLDRLGLTLTVALPPDEVPGLADAGQLSRVVRNLLSNAGKFTPAGGWVRVRLAVDGAEARLSVQDSGVGIATAELERIFEKFLQLDGSLTRTVGGAGLGLALCRRIVENGHGGRIWAESVVGEGTTVHLALPLAAGMAAPESPSLPANTDHAAADNG